MYHETNPVSDRAKGVHNMVFNTDTPDMREFFREIGAEKLLTKHSHYSVNSIHHQTVLTVPDNAIVLGEYAEPKSVKAGYDIEALGYITYPAYTVQYHPEEFNDFFSRRLVMDLLKARATGQSSLEKIYESVDIC
jgi:GMP synthase-like glutamine amidotransferase